MNGTIVAFWMRFGSLRLLHELWQERFLIVLRWRGFMALSANGVIVVVRRERRILGRGGRKIGNGIGDRVCPTKRNDDSFGIRCVRYSYVATGIGEKRPSVPCLLSLANASMRPSALKYRDQFEALELLTSAKALEWFLYAR